MSSPYILPKSLTKAGGGGGGDRSKLVESKGALPRLSREQITPPVILVRNENPKLPIEPTVVVPPNIKLPQLGQIGDPLSAVLAPPSNVPALPVNQNGAGDLRSPIVFATRI